MAIKTIMTITEKKYSLGFIAALLVSTAVLFGLIKSKDNEIDKWVNRTIACEQDKILRLDKSLAETQALLYSAQELVRKNDSINSANLKKKK